MDEDNDGSTALSEALQQLLFRGSGAKVQVMYVTLQDGRQLIFLGSPLNEDDYENIVDFVLGETIDPVTFSHMSALLMSNLTAH
jgi:hypothetical protein